MSRGTVSRISGGQNESGYSGLRVLAVEENIPELTKLMRMLRYDCGYNVTAKPSVEEALKVVGDKPEEVCDLFMTAPIIGRRGRKSGFDLLDHVRRKVPVVMFSSDSPSETVLRAIKEGVHDYLVKPIPVEELRNLWRHAVRSRMSAAVDRTTRKRSRSGDDGSDEGGEGGDGRMKWTEELHSLFVKAVNKLFATEQTPLRIRELLEDEHVFLTEEQVEIHLQEYRKDCMMDKRSTPKAGLSGTTSSPNGSSSLVKNFSSISYGSIYSAMVNSSSVPAGGRAHETSPNQPVSRQNYGRLQDTETGFGNYTVSNGSGVEHGSSAKQKGVLCVEASSSVHRGALRTESQAFRGITSTNSGVHRNEGNMVGVEHGSSVKQKGVLCVEESSSVHRGALGSGSQAFIGMASTGSGVHRNEENMVGIEHGSSVQQKANLCVEAPSPVHRGALGSGNQAFRGITSTDSGVHRNEVNMVGIEHGSSVNQKGNLCVEAPSPVHRGALGSGSQAFRGITSTDSGVHRNEVNMISALPKTAAGHSGAPMNQSLVSAPPPSSFAQPPQPLSTSLPTDLNFFDEPSPVAQDAVAAQSSQLGNNSAPMSPDWPRLEELSDDQLYLNSLLGQNEFTVGVTGTDMSQQANGFGTINEFSTLQHPPQGQAMRGSTTHNEDLRNEDILASAASLESNSVQPPQPVFPDFTDEFFILDDLQLNRLFGVDNNIQDSTAMDMNQQGFGSTNAVSALQSMFNSDFAKW